MERALRHRLTLDTNVARDVLEPNRHGHETLQKLVALADEGEVELIVTARIEADAPTDPLAAQLRELPELGIGRALPSMRFDVDSWDAAVWGDQRFIDACTAILESGWQPSAGAPPDWRDQDHLHAHFLHRRDVFLTRDRALREFCDELTKRGLPISAVTPEDYLGQREDC